MMMEAIGLAIKGAAQDGAVEFTHQSVVQAAAFWTQREFNDVDAPYFMVDDEVKLNGREWRAAPVDSVVSILSAAHHPR